MSKKKMVNITISLPEIFIENIERFQNAGIVASRSDAIRTAIREFLEKETAIISLLGFEIEEGESSEET